MEQVKRKDIEQIKADLTNISPLALPQYLAECEFYDMEDSQKVLSAAIQEFDKSGGVTSNLIESIWTGTVNGGALILLKKLDKPQTTYEKAKKGGINFGNILKQIKDFNYPEEYLPKPNNQFAQSLQYDRYRRADSSINKHQEGYDRRQWADSTKMNEFKNANFTNKDVIGVNVYRTTEESRFATGKENYAVHADHIVSLNRLSEEHSNFAGRYMDDRQLKEIVNSIKNLQPLNASSNESKGSLSHKDWIKNTERRLSIEKQRLNDPHLSDIKRKKLEEIVIRREQEISKKKELLTIEKKAKLDIHIDMLSKGGENVLIQQIGKIIETLIGPISYEIKDAIKNGLSYGFDTDNKLKGLLLRIWRILKYIASQLLRIIGDLIGDLSTMIAQFFAEMAKIIRNFFGKFLDVALSGISIIIEAIKILLDPKTNSVQKGDAVSKLIVTFLTTIIGQFLIDLGLNALGLPDPFSELISVVVSSALSAVVVYFFDKLDIFNIKRELRNQRINEIFELRIKKIKEDGANFDLVVTETMKQQRIQFEEIKAGIRISLDSNEYDGVNKFLDSASDFFKIKIPYSNPLAFIEYVKNNNEILIS